MEQQQATLTLLGFDNQGGADRLTAALIATTPGIIDAPPMPDIQVSLHVGAPIWASCGYPGHMHRRRQFEGDLDLLPPGIAGTWYDEGPAKFLLMRLPNALLQSAGGQPASIAPRFHFRDTRVHHIGNALRAELEDGGPNGRTYIDALGLALAAHLVGRYGGGKEEARPEPCAPTLSPRQVRRVRQHIETNMKSDLSMKELADVASISLSHFRAMFGRTFGMPPHRYLVERRVERARALIAADVAPLAEIALMVGFAHQSHLTRWMRRLTGVTPAALKRRA